MYWATTRCLLWVCIINQLNSFNMNKKVLLLCTVLVALLSFNATKAQVKDASITLGAGLEYEFLDKALNIDNAMLWGVRAGFGFGPIVELRGVYDRSFGIKSKLEQGAE